MKNKFNVRKSQKELQKFINKNYPLILKNLEKAYQERQKMEKQIQDIIDKTEKTFGEKKVKKIGHGGFVLIPKDYVGRKVEVLLLKEEETIKE